MNKFLPFKSVLVIFIFASSAALSQPTLLKDINANLGSLQAENTYQERFCSCGGYLYFNAITELGNELWRTDGTIENTILIKDINKGFSDGLARGSFLLCANNKLFFAGNGEENGPELWVTDGSPSGTQELSNISSSDYYATPSFATQLQDKVYFFTGNNLKPHLWQSDGTPEGTNLITQIDSSYPLASMKLTSTDDRLFFVLGSNLWTSDGTADGNVLLKADVRSETLTAVGNKVYFAVAGKELWSSDGTVAGTQKIVTYPSIGSNFFRFNDKIIFPGGGTSVSDGTVAGTTTLSADAVRAGTTINNIFYGFVGGKILRTDGTVAGSNDISLGGGYSDVTIYNEIASLGDKLILPVFATAYGQELGICDGTQAGTELIKDIFPGATSSRPRSWGKLDDKVYFIANDEEHGSEIWVTDGTTEGTRLFMDLKQGSDDAFTPLPNFIPPYFQILNDRVYFMAGSQRSSLPSLWQTDGTTGGTVEYHQDQSLTYLGRTDSHLYYLGGKGLYKTNGLEGGVTLLREWAFGEFGGATYNSGIKVGDKLVFRIVVNPYGVEYWVTDGTTAGTNILKDIYPGTSSGAGYGGAVLNGKLIFGANDGLAGSELWISDGTTAGTVLLKDINAGSGASGAVSFITWNDVVLFSANDGVHGTELWKTDGTEVGTVLVKDINLQGNADVRYFTPFGDQILFAAYNDESGWSLWKSDGTPEGTGLVKTISKDNGYIPDNFKLVNGKLFFAAKDAEHGKELWVSDGTTSGTYRIELAPGASSSNPGYFTDVQGFLYFKANAQMWRTDGSVERTEMVTEMEPFEMFSYNNLIYFVSPTREYGVELFTVPFTKFDQQISFSPIPTCTMGDEALTLTAKSTSGLSVLFSSASDNITITSNTVELKGPGEVIIYASQPGSALFNEAPESSQTFCINPAKPNLTVSNAIELTSSSDEGNSWFLNGVLIPSATGKTLVAEESGHYTVQVTAGSCKSVISNEVPVVITGTENQEKLQVYLYPNPTSHKLIIRSELQEELEVTILDSKGQTRGGVSVSSRSTVEYPLDEYRVGVYLVRITSKRGISYQKFVKN